MFFFSCCNSVLPHLGISKVPSDLILKLGPWLIKNMNARKIQHYEYSETPAGSDCEIWGASASSLRLHLLSLFLADSIAQGCLVQQGGGGGGGANNSLGALMKSHCAPWATRPHTHTHMHWHTHTHTLAHPCVCVHSPGVAFTNEFCFNGTETVKGGGEIVGEWRRWKSERRRAVTVWTTLSSHPAAAAPDYHFLIPFLILSARLLWKAAYHSGCLDATAFLRP